MENEKIRYEGVDAALAEGRTVACHARVGARTDTGARLAPGSVVKFTSGATRSTESTFDPSGFLSPAVLVSFCQYMERHRHQADGALRASDNWQKGMPTSRAWRSLTRHFLDAWLLSRGYASVSPDCFSIEDALHGVLFNVQVLLKNRIDGNHHEEEK